MLEAPIALILSMLGAKNRGVERFAPIGGEENVRKSFIINNIYIEYIFYPPKTDFATLDECGTALRRGPANRAVTVTAHRDGASSTQQSICETLGLMTYATLLESRGWGGSKSRRHSP